MKRGIMVIVTRPQQPPQFVKVESREDAEKMVEIAELMGFRDAMGTPIELEIVEYTDSPL